LTNSDTDTAYRLEREKRRDNFLWKKATSENTIASYHDYLRQYPAGSHAGEASQKIHDLGQPPAKTNEALR
jgi:hypothetical protein